MSGERKSQARFNHDVARIVGWTLLAGGAAFFVGGSMHPKQDPPGVSVKEHLRVMFEDPGWYPAHALMLVGIALIAVALVALARSRSLAGAPRTHAALVVAAVAAAAAAPAMLLHLVAAADADAIAAGGSTTLTDVQNVVETVMAPAFGFSIAALAIAGAVTGTLGDRISAAFGTIGGIGYGLAGGTFLFTDALNALFPAATGIAVWAMAAGVGLLRRRRSTARLREQAA